MRDELAKLFYDSGAINVKGEDLSVELTNLLKRPGWIREVSSYITRELDEYAIDSISATSDALPYATLCAGDLGFPIQWVRVNQVTAGTVDVKRTMLLTSLTPQEEEINAYVQLFAAANIELVGIYAILGLRPPKTTVRILSLTPLVDILEVYRRLYLIDESVHDTLIQKLT